MKTANLQRCPLCTSTLVKNLDEHLLNDHLTALSRIKQIQFNAMKEGMRRAEIIAFGEMVGLKDPFEFKKSIRKAILTAAEQLTEKDL